MKPLRRLPVILSVVWFIGLVVAFLATHNPISGAGFMALGRAVQGTAAVVLICALSGGVGRRLFHDENITEHENLVIQFLIGSYILYILVLAAAVLQLIPPAWGAWIVVLLLCIIFNNSIFAWLSGVHQFVVMLFLPLDSWFVGVLRVFVMSMLLLAIILAFAPPTEWDALTYHLTGPQLYLENGGMVSVQENHFLGFPGHTSMLYMLVMLLSNASAAALLHACFGGAVLVLVFEAAARFTDDNAGWVAVAVLLASVSIWGEFAWAYNDLSLMAYTTAALSLVLAWSDTQEPRLLAWAGVMVGGMLSVKYTAAGFALALGIVVLWAGRRDGLVALLRSGLTITLIAAGVFLPWLVRNMVVDGSLFSPFPFAGAGFDELDNWHYLRAGTGLPLSSLPALIIQIPVFSQEGGMFQGESGVLVFALLPLIAIGWASRKTGDESAIDGILVFLLMGLVYFLVGAATSWFLLQTRLLFPIFPAAAIICSVGYASFDQSTAFRGYASLLRAGILAAAGATLLSAMLVFLQENPLAVIFGLESEEDYLMEQLQGHYAAIEAVNNLPAGSRILFLWEPRVLYCEKDCIPDSLINQWWHDLQIYGEADEVLNAWMDRDITHVLIFESGARFLVEEEPYAALSEQDLRALQSMRGNRLIPVWDALESYTLYRLSDAESP